MVIMVVSHKQPVEKTEVSQVPNIWGEFVPLYTKEDSDRQKTPLGLVVVAKFTEEFVEKYQYEDAQRYSFAIKIDGNYYDVYRNSANGVSNSIKDGLTGAVPAYQFKDWYSWRIPFGKISVANKIGSVGYHETTLLPKEDYKIEISPVKEGVETHEFDYYFYY